MAAYFFGTDQSTKNITCWPLKRALGESADTEGLMSFLMASHVLLLLCPTLSNAQPVIRVFSAGSKKPIKAAAEKTARDWIFRSCMDAQSELGSMVVMLVSIQFDRSGGSPQRI